MDFYLSPQGTQYLPEIRRLARLNTADADDQLLHYCMEAIRLNGTFGSYRVAANRTTVVDGRGADAKRISVEPGDKVFVSFVGAARDPVVFPDPDEVRLDRPLESYIHYGEGPHTCLGRDASRVALTAMLKVVGSLNNLRRVSGLLRREFGEEVVVLTAFAGTGPQGAAEEDSQGGWVLCLHEGRSRKLLPFPVE